jgi:hypothetical protein
MLEAEPTLGELQLATREPIRRTPTPKLQSQASPNLPLRQTYPAANRVLPASQTIQEASSLHPVAQKGEKEESAET